MHDVIVIGGGVIGLSIARELAGRIGRNSVLLLERGAVGQGTSWAAAGMLSPQSEADASGPFIELCHASREMFPQWVENLTRETGIDALFSDEGLLFYASSEKELETLQRRCQWQKGAGFSAEILSAAEARRMEPLVTAACVGALYLPRELSVAPRLLVQALGDSCKLRGVEIRSGVKVGNVSELKAGAVVVASGVWSAELGGLEPRIPVYPRKGQILSLRMPGGGFRRMIRWKHSYFVPRRDGELVVGATNEDVGFDYSLTPAGIGSLLAEAQEISSHTGAWPIQETWTGLRPATPDERPIIGASSVPGVYYATGHYRNGVLLAPITASIVADLVQQRDAPVDISPYSPYRF